MSAKQNILGITRDGLADFFTQHRGSAFHAKEVMEAVYRNDVRDFSKVESITERYRAILNEHFSIELPQIVKVQGSEDTTRKYLFQLSDGRYIESVLIPATPLEDGTRSNRMTVCVSSQVGCAYGCKFCASGLDGLTRNLTTAEIISQLVAIREHSGKVITNVVFMGMGEPLANFKNLNPALDIITGHWGLHLAPRSVTVSTSGLVPMIRKLAERENQVSLAISLHGATDEVRDKIMPVNSKWQVAELFDALHYFASKNKQRITLEYILIKGINDELEQAEILAEKAKKLGGFVNLIPYNTVEGLEWERPSDEHCKLFRDTVKNLGVMTTMRLEKGHDIDAACGQLRLKEMKKTAEAAKA
ncbi:23S rRNA (adenine(2503)-C(2))-methyltransferase RlmN [Rubritalea sp.]|uniref:23S rRNA (adenine(2503)-C(2))-methyltransferase RlmN n=1 Tax=Rubritalea sp. TaxID=2109375 RepID=UPI003EF17E00